MGMDRILVGEVRRVYGMVCDVRRGGKAGGV